MLIDKDLDSFTRSCVKWTRNELKTATNCSESHSLNSQSELISRNGIGLTLGMWIRAQSNYSSVRRHTSVLLVSRSGPQISLADESHAISS